MKKLYYSTTLIFSLFLTNFYAQINVADFENLNLTPESYWDGSDLSGQHNNLMFNSTFNAGDYQFSNTYDTTYGAVFGYWSTGWSYSNITDSSTSGSGNLFSSKAGGGHGIGGANYAVGTNNSTVVLNNPENFSVNISNSTYAANSMRDGDAFAKKFTNVDQDFFKIHIYGYSNGTLIDSTEFYLADFTHADSSLDYIVTDWQYIELGPNIYDSVQFKLTSSDVGQFGMNTPAYFCIDNVGNYPLSNNHISEYDLEIYPNPSSEFLFIKTNNEINYSVTLFNILGEEILEKQMNTKQLNISNLPNGQYILKFESKDGIINESIFKL
ncbi:MAG: DUF4465 domain-containing protein [Flavobacteriales bacterium]|nr:DUF4465 domain-containing protein [Flavobacteriales bacterium]